MKKVFLYLYPIKEYMETFLNTSVQENKDFALNMLNLTIDKRYKEKGYEIVIALYPDKELYGINKKLIDRIIYTNLPFSDFSAYDEFGKLKKNHIVKYPSEQYLLSQLGDIDKLIIGGYHTMDCVKKVGEFALQMGIDTLVDLELTDLFFNLYQNKEYFDLENYSPNRFKKYVFSKLDMENIEFEEKLFNQNYSSPVYGFNIEKGRIK